MKIKLGFKSELPGIVAVAVGLMAFETLIIWWVVNQFYAIGWQQALAIYITKFLLTNRWRIRKAD